MVNNKTLIELVRERRGWSPEELDRLNSSTDQQLLDMDTMVHTLEQLRLSGHLLVITPDFDMDGISAGTLAWAGFSELGFNVGLHVPDPENGHGLSPAEVDTALASYPDAACLITCDTGIDSHQGIRHAASRGVPVLVTDHHIERSVEERVPALVVVDPMRADDKYPDGGICGAQVIHKVLLAYTQTYQPHRYDDILRLRLLAGLGTVADAMPITKENRAVVASSVALAQLLYPGKTEPDFEHTTLGKILSAQPHHPRYMQAFTGFYQLLRGFISYGKLRSVQDVSETFYGFYLAPAFNSLRRIQWPVQHGFDVFFGANPAEATAAVIQASETRKALVAEQLEYLKTSDQPHAPHIYLCDATSGVLGLLAQNMMNLNAHPACVLNRTVSDSGEVRLSGSVRSPGWLELNTPLRKAGYWAAGHEQAFGLRLTCRLEDEARYLAEFASAMDRIISTTRAELLAKGTPLTTPADVFLGDSGADDAPLQDSVAVRELIDWAESVGPFGRSFPQITAAGRITPSECVITTMGSEKQHLKITTARGVDLIWWNKSAMLPQIIESSEAVLKGQLEINTFRGQSKLTMIVSELVESAENTTHHQNTLQAAA